MKNKVCLITGATSEIGEAISIRFASSGCDLILHYHTKKEEALRIKENLESKYDTKVFLVQADLESEDSIKEMVEKIFVEFSKIDYLINNAAICLDSLYQDKTKINFLRTLDVNIIGTFLLSRLIGNKMYDEKFGKIVILSSTNGIDKYFPMSIDYDASKAGLISIMHNLSIQYSPYVNVNAVAPGWVATKKELEGLDSEYIKSEEEKIFLNRFGMPKEIANVVYFLCSDESSYINNSVIRVDGGTYNG